MFYNLAIIYILILASRKLSIYS